VARFPRGPAGWPGRMTKATTVLSGGYTELLVGQCGGLGQGTSEVLWTRIPRGFEHTFELERNPLMQESVLFSNINT
jgi:hypothetical protein